MTHPCQVELLPLQHRRARDQGDGAGAARHGAARQGLRVRQHRRLLAGARRAAAARRRARARARVCVWACVCVCVCVCVCGCRGKDTPRVRHTVATCDHVTVRRVALYLRHSANRPCNVPTCQRLSSLLAGVASRCDDVAQKDTPFSRLLHRDEGTVTWSSHVVTTARRGAGGARDPGVLSWCTPCHAP